MRIVLVDPTLPWPRGPRAGWAPLGLAYLAAVLRQEGHEVHIHNRLARQCREQLSLEALDRETVALLREVQPDLVGIGGPTTCFPDTRAVARLVREAVPAARMVLGGPHATIAPRETLERIPEADCLVLGEGERRLAELAAGRSASELPGAYWRREDGGVGENAWKPETWEIDSLPFPARDLLDMEWYTSWDARGVRGSPVTSLTMLTSRGCHHRCAFCGEPAWTVRGVRCHSPEYVVAEAEEVLAQYPVECIVFLDEMFTSDRERTLALAELWQQRGLHKRVSFTIQARADGLDDELLAALKRAGCLQIELGIESGSERMLEEMRKGLTVEQNRRAVAAVKAAGIRAQANVIVGAPGETKADFDASMRLLDELKPDVVVMGHYFPLPKTAFAQQLARDGQLAEDFWAIEERTTGKPDWNFSAIAPDRFDQMCRQARRRATRLNRGAWLEQVPLWRGLRRRLGHMVAQRRQGPVRFAGDARAGERQGR